MSFYLQAVRECKGLIWRPGNAVELELAISSVIGSGLFICCVSLASVLFVQRIEIGPGERCTTYSNNRNTTDIWCLTLKNSSHHLEILEQSLECCCLPGSQVLFVFMILCWYKTYQRCSSGRLPFVRDVLAYLIASAITLAFLWNGRFALSEALVLLAAYVAYIATCIATSR